MLLGDVERDGEGCAVAMPLMGLSIDSLAALKIDLGDRRLKPSLVSFLAISALSACAPPLMKTFLHAARPGIVNYLLRLIKTMASSTFNAVTPIRITPSRFWVLNYSRRWASEADAALT
ncbi:hypothetical protein [Bradyrhizobium tropiciagri]|uniref:hypothetical protein n=1 Tax=Bradyrhizobium tropiciagri TaxID=312253 RepID=UPI00067CFFB8|nr:hypothetical protein [Bradyrhizobium tropiciagri]